MFASVLTLLRSITFKADFGGRCSSPQVGKHYSHRRALCPRLPCRRLGQANRGRHQAFGNSALAEISQRCRARMDDHIEDPRHHAQGLQGRRASRICFFQPGRARGDTLQDQLPGNRPHPETDACHFAPPPSQPTAPRTVLTCAATALRSSEILALRWAVILWLEGKIRVSKRWAHGKDGETKTEASEGYVPMHPLLAQQLRGWHGQTPYAKQSDFVFPSFREQGKKPLYASSFVADYLRPAAITAGVSIAIGQRFGLHNLRHSLSLAGEQGESAGKNCTVVIAPRADQNHARALHAGRRGRNTGGAGRVPGSFGNEIGGNPMKLWVGLWVEASTTLGCHFLVSI
jgi:integrase